MEKLGKVLLVDDDDIVNSINKKIIEHADFASNVEAVTSADEAMDYLMNCKSYLPELIFLDINMPVKNGWDFIDDFERSDFLEQKPSIVVLSSSIDPRDREMADTFESVIDFVSKPILVGTLDKLSKAHFEN